MNAERAAGYVGKAYDDNGFGPDSFNCWGFLIHIQRVEFGRELPAFPIGDVEASKAAHTTALDSGQYAIVTVPMHGDCVLLRGGNCPHVGVWLDLDGGGVLHSLGGVGVIWTPKTRLSQLGYSRLVFYRVRDARSIHSTQRPIPTDN